MNFYFEEIYKLALIAYENNDVPVGALIEFNGKIIARGFNDRKLNNNIIGHAEINVIREACKKLKQTRLDGCNLYVTLKPCKMCNEIIKEAKIDNVYYLLEPLNEKENRYKFPVKYNKNNTNLSIIYKKKLSEFFADKRK